MSRSFDTISSTNNDQNGNFMSVSGVGEVKTTDSTRTIPGTDALGYFLASMYSQIAEQKTIALSCGFGYQLHVQEGWQVLLGTLWGHSPSLSCPSKGVDTADPKGTATLQELLALYGYAYLDALE